MSEQLRSTGIPDDYKFFKKIGIFEIFGKKAETGWKDANTGFELKPGDYFYELRLINNKPEGPLLDQAQESMKSLADTIREARFQPKVVSAFTYEKMEQAAKRKGFREADTTIPKKIIKDVEKNYKKTSPLFEKGIPPGKTLLIYQPTKELLNRYK